MTASLGMYDMPALREANDRFWALIRRNLGRGPPELTRDRDVWDVWHAPDLVLAQTCGMPYRTRLHGRVNLVGTPDYGLPGCGPGQYNSVLVGRRGEGAVDLVRAAAGVLAYNEALSQSGWAAPVTHLAAAGLSPAGLLETGSHAASARAVAEGRADLAGLDALTWALLEEHDRDLTARLHVIARTDPTPALPYITAAGHDPAPVARALRAAIRQLDPADRQRLHLRGLVDIPAEDYLAVPTPPGPDAERA